MITDQRIVFSLKEQKTCKYFRVLLIAIISNYADVTFSNIEGYIKDDADTDDTHTLDRTSVHHSMGLRYNNEDEDRVPKFGQGGVLESLN